MIFSANEHAVPSAVMPVIGGQSLDELKPSVPSASSSSRNVLVMDCVHRGLPNTKPPLSDEDRRALAMNSWYQIVLKGASGTDTGDMLDSVCEQSILPSSLTDMGSYSGIHYAVY